MSALIIEPVSVGYRPIILNIDAIMRALRPVVADVASELWDRRRAQIKLLVIADKIASLLPAELSDVERFSRAHEAVFGAGWR